MTPLRELIAAFVVTFAFSALDDAYAKGPTKRNLKLFVHGTGCEHEFEAKPVKLQRAKQGAIGWRVKNDCNIQRRVTICTYDASGKRANPFGTCTSNPPNLSLATAFTLAATGGAAEIDCGVAQEGSYTAYAVVGDLMKPGTCPASPPKEKMMGAGEKTFHHRLAIEIVP